MPVIPEEGDNTNQYFMDMINLRKNIKKEGEQKKLFNEQARTKDEELKKVQTELENIKSSKTEESEKDAKERVLIM